jgi:hypothetical protein
MQTVEQGTASAADVPATEVYPVLAKHQREEQWVCREIIGALQTWADRFTVEFNLDIPEVVLRIDWLPRTRYGHFRSDHNGFGLRGEIALNARYLTGQRQFWEVLGTLLHELLHGWQQAHGMPSEGNHHNTEFRNKARELGLIVDRRGATGYAATSSFKDLLRRFGVECPDAEIFPEVRIVAGQSKLKKWSCGCTNVWVACGGFQARCLKCSNDFTREEVHEADESPEGGSSTNDE